MENNNQKVAQVESTEQNLSPLHTVTPLSKYLAMGLFIILPFLGGWIGYTYAPEKEIVFERVTEKIVEVPTEKKVFISDEYSNHMKDSNEASLVAMYLDSNFEVVHTAHSPFGTSEYFPYHKVSIVSPRGINDLECGQRHGPNTCYFFLEAAYAETPDTTYLGSWSEGAIDYETVEYLNQNTLQFEAYNDGGRYLWQYDLRNTDQTLIEVIQENTF